MPDVKSPRDAARAALAARSQPTPGSAPEGPPSAPTGLLGRDAILQAPDLSFADVFVPEWGGTVRVRMLNGRERDAFEASCLHEKRDGTRVFDPRNLRAKLVALCLVGEDGTPLFGQDDIAALGHKSAKALATVFDEAAKVNGLSPKDVESLEGNSDGQGDDSSSASLWPLDAQSES